MIRYDSAYNQEINRVVSNFNRKVRRLEQAENRLLPSPVSVKEIKEHFSSKRELNKYLNDLRRFGKRGAEEIVTVKGKEYSRYQIDVFRANLRRERAEISRALKKAEGVKHRYPMQHDVYVQNLRNKKAKLTQNWTDLLEGNIWRTAYRDFINTEIYDNYLEVLFQDAYQTGFDPDKVEYIKNKLLQLSPNEFIQALEDSPEIKFIFDYYHALTRQSGVAGTQASRDAYEQLYKRIDEIVKTYK